MYAEKKWEVSAEKVRYALAFPSLVLDAAIAAQKSVEQTIALPEATLTIYTDKTFSLSPADTNDVAKFMNTLRAAKPHLYEHHPTAFDKLDELTRLDLEYGRLSKMEKILSSIVGNAADLPELYTLAPQMLDGTSTFKAAQFPDATRGLRIERILKAIASNLPLIPELRDELPKLLRGESTLVQCDLFKSFAARNPT
ncbi:MAG: hypothetical protein IAF08_06685 [Rhizobacter sp.]|nr:hypothetical protein [Chlorobiales bacterium]